MKAFTEPNRLNRFLRVLGPGIITGAADDDPSGIATYTQAGAQFGYGQLWTAVFMLPFLIAIQECCARIGLVTGKGIAKVVRENYGAKILYGVVILVVVANTINIGADIGAMAAAAALAIPISEVVLILLLTAAVLLLQVFTSYKVYSKILKWLALVLIAYPITAFIVNEPWVEVIKATFIPHIGLSFGFLFIITGVLGTIISPYMFFWEASEEVEEEIERHETRSSGKPSIGWGRIREIRFDNALGMIVSEVATWSMILVGASVLNRNGITHVGTAADAAKALEPLVQTFPNSGFLARTLFAAGVVGLGLLAVPVLAGSASYTLSEALGWKEGLSLNIKQAHGFYGIITIATVIGLALNFVGIDPVRALVYAARHQRCGGRSPDLSGRLHRTEQENNGGIPQRLVVEHIRLAYVRRYGSCSRSDVCYLWQEVGSYMHAYR